MFKQKQDIEFPGFEDRKEEKIESSQVDGVELCKTEDGEMSEPSDKDLQNQESKEPSKSTPLSSQDPSTPKNFQTSKDCPNTEEDLSAFKKFQKSLTQDSSLPSTWKNYFLGLSYTDFKQIRKFFPMQSLYLTPSNPLTYSTLQKHLPSAFSQSPSPFLIPNFPSSYYYRSYIQNLLKKAKVQPIQPQKNFTKHLRCPAQVPSDIFFKGRIFEKRADFNQALKEYKRFGYSLIIEKSELKKGRFKLLCDRESRAKRLLQSGDEFGCEVNRCGAFVNIYQMKVKSLNLEHSHLPCSGEKKEDEQDEVWENNIREETKESCSPSLLKLDTSNCHENKNNIRMMQQPDMMNQQMIYYNQNQCTNYHDFYPLNQLAYNMYCYGNYYRNPNCMYQQQYRCTMPCCVNNFPLQNFQKNPPNFYHQRQSSQLKNPRQKQQIISHNSNTPSIVQKSAPKQPPKILPEALQASPTSVKILSKSS